MSTASTEEPSFPTSSHRHAQITDSHLLTLAVARCGRLATLDRKLIADAVVGGKAALQTI